MRKEGEKEQEIIKSWNTGNCNWILADHIFYLKSNLMLTMPHDVRYFSKLMM